ncbi:MAG TPA: PfkB family carbohydrate kinase [Candidatus Paceibacterota bacterium]
MSDLRFAIGKFKGVKAVVMGDIMLDRWTFGDVDRISPEAPVPVVLKKSEKITLGGAANVANNLAALGASVSLVGVMGDDEAGDLITGLLEQSNIDAKAILRFSNRPTIEKQRIVFGENHQLLRLDSEQRGNLTPTEEERSYALLLPLVKECDVIVLSDYGKGFFSEQFAQKIIALAKTEKKTVLADLKPAHKKYFFGVDVITPNLKEAREMTGLSDLLDVGPKLVQEFGAHAIVTLGGEGMSLFRREDASHYHAPGKKIKVFDVSGAGDTSIAVLALGMAGGLNIDDAVMLANEAGSIVVQKPGTATLSREELMSALRTTNHVEGISMTPKVWGYERWVENNDRYCCKILGVNKGYQCSLHYHKNKDETFLVTEGQIRFELGDEVMHLRPGSFIRVPPNTPHRFAGIEDSLIMEFSTHHDDADSYRIEESRKMDE